ncbi:MAG TPA: PqqD family protein [Gaiellaceae bacterium]|nr:PqqD family protein [Gaiellaceae bacterium]
MPYRINSPQVISETVADETIIVNLATGHYFNLQGTAVEIWDALERGEEVDGIVRSLGERYEAANGEIPEAVDGLVRELVENDLIVPEENRDAVVVPAVASPDGAGGRRPFVAPTLTTFTDMQDIILLDPVHEVDARGWPHTAPES